MSKTVTCLFLLALFSVVLFSVSALADNNFEQAREDLIKKLEIYNKKAKQQRQALFSSGVSIAEACQRKIQRPKAPKKDAFFHRLKDDPVSLPVVDCIYIHKENSRYNEFVRFQPLEGKAGFLTVRQTHSSPVGFFIGLSKHPLHEIRLNLGPVYGKATRITIQPADVFPIQAGDRFRLVESGYDRQERLAKVWVEKSFIIKRKGEIIDQLHLLMRDDGVKKFFGTKVKVRKWYLYSQTANALLDQGPYSVSCSFAKIAKNERSYFSIRYFKDGQLIAALTKQELKPVRDALKTFAFWSTTGCEPLTPLTKDGLKRLRQKLEK